MRIAHISDLHLGKNLHGFSLIEDQAFILNEIAEICSRRKIDVLIVAGDIYDKNVASIEGIKLLRNFLNNLVQRNIKILLISGNHDSAERLTFGGEFMTEKGIYFSRVYDGLIEPINIEDECGSVNFYLLPFIKPGDVKHYFPDEKIESYDDAVKVAVKKMQVNFSERNVIVAHQNIMNAQLCESEEHIIGGLDAVSAGIFKDFDYAALGHIHTPQKPGEAVVYCGTPLKYSLSEMKKDKSMPVIEFGKKGELKIEYEPLKPLRDLREIKGRFYDILEMSKKDSYNHEDYISIILTDETEVLDAISTLREVYPNVVSLIYDNETTRNEAVLEAAGNTHITNPLELFENFFETRSGRVLDEKQRAFMQELILKTFGEN